MSEPAYTLAMYRTKPGQEENFVAAWKDLVAIFETLPQPPLWATLIRSNTDPTVFYGFGPWNDAAHVQAMRASPEVQQAMGRIAGLCVELTPGNYKLAAHFDVAGKA